MNKKWFSGPPPSMGWWPASFVRNPACFRWWDGRRWSREAYADWGAKAAGMQAKKFYPPQWDSQCQIEWQHRPDSWPERSKT